MEFGRLSPEELETVAFELPDDGVFTAKVLTGSRNPACTVMVGCAKWGRKDWIGTLYPPKTKEADFLGHYSRHFRTIELNATFYKTPTRAQTKSWSDQVEDDFLFCPKVSQGISHIRRLKNAGESLSRFIDGISGFEKKLGPVFLVPHPQMTPKAMETIQSFLADFPREIPLFLELRHEQWYDASGAWRQLCGFLYEQKIGTVITDALGRRDCVHMELTVPEAFIRFVGNGLHPSDYQRIDDWVTRIGKWMENGIQKVWFFMHQHDELHSPRLCKYLIEQLNQRCGCRLKEIEFAEN